jgi:hypothetical protein
VIGGNFIKASTWMNEKENLMTHGDPNLKINTIF